MENQPVKPSLLFQYRPPKVWAFGNLNRRVLYFNSPMNFNDPHDFRYPPSWRNMTDEDFAYLKDAFDRDERLQYRQGESKEEYAARANRIIAADFAALREYAGFACFSEHHNNLPMWSHYGGQGKGFCLAFDTRGGLFDDDNITLAKMQYRDNLPDAADAVRDYKKRSESFYYSIVHKSTKWKYEDEWRLVKTQNRQGKDREVHYDAKALAAVYLGVDASDNTAELVRTIAGERYPHAELYRAQLDEDKYELEFARLL